MIFQDSKGGEAVTELILLLEPYDDWFNDAGEEKNLEAQEALYLFYERFKNFKPEREYRRNLLHMSYLPFMIKIKEAFMERKYMRVCNELISLMYYQPCLQNRIYYNVIKLLEDSLGTGRETKMLKRPRKTVKSTERPAQEFIHAIDFMKLVLETEKSDKDKIIILDFMLSAIREDLKTDLLTHIFYSEEHFNRRLDYPFPLFYSDEQGNEISLKEEKEIEIDLAADCVLTLPWNRGRLRNQIKNLFNNDFVYHSNNHWAYYFPYLGLCYVYNGKHSVASGIVYKKGKIEAKQYDITKLFPHVYADGQNWYNSHTREKKGKLADFRLGIIFEVAKAKYQLENH
mgnify:CR=1 FL=1